MWEKKTLVPDESMIYKPDNKWTTLKPIALGNNWESPGDGADHWGIRDSAQSDYTNLTEV